MDVKCDRCGKIIYDGECMTSISAMVSEIQNRELDVLKSTWLYRFCDDCSEEMDFYNVYVQDEKVPDVPKEHSCRICGKIIGDGDYSFDTEITKERYDGDEIQPECADLLMSYCEDCMKIKDIENIIVPEKCIKIDTGVQPQN